MDLEEKDNYLKEGTILVTGGGGSIGSELCGRLPVFRQKIIILTITKQRLRDTPGLTDTYKGKPR